MINNKGVIDICSIPKFKNLPKERILAVAEKMIERGLMEWIDKSKYLAKITGIGEGVYEAQQPSN